MTALQEIPASQVEHEFGMALVEAAKAIFSYVAQDFAQETRDRIRAARNAGAALEIRVQIVPAPLVECVVEAVTGETWTVFSLVPKPIASD